MVQRIYSAFFFWGGGSGLGARESHALRAKEKATGGPGRHRLPQDKQHPKRHSEPRKAQAPPKKHKDTLKLLFGPMVLNRKSSVLRFLFQSVCVLQLHACSIYFAIIYVCFCQTFHLTPSVSVIIPPNLCFQRPQECGAGSERYQIPARGKVNGKFICF